MSFKELSRDELLGCLEDFAKNWLAHDGLWFLAAEEKYGMDIAMELDKKAWSSFAAIEAKRIKKRLSPPDNGGLDALKKAIHYRMYSAINKYTVYAPEPGKLIYKMLTCRVQTAREKKGLPPFPCKSVGLIEFPTFAQTIAPSIKTKCLACPPDEGKRDFVCGWEFTI